MPESAFEYFVLGIKTLVFNLFYRMKCVEMVVTGIEEGTQVVSEVELKLAEHQDLPDELDDLERVHQELLDIQQIVQDHQVCIAAIVFYFILESLETIPFNYNKAPKENKPQTKISPTGVD